MTVGCDQKLTDAVGDSNLYSIATVIGLCYRKLRLIFSFFSNDGKRGKGRGWGVIKKLRENKSLD